MVTLHLEPGDVESITAGGDGSTLVNLTAEGERQLVELAERRRKIVEAEGLRDATWLRALSDERLLRLAKSQLGGPSPDVLSEVRRRIQLATAKLRPALDALRGVGLLPAPEAPGAGGVK